MIAKNEGKYLVEWVYFYHILGFDEIIIYDNESNDNTNEILKKLSKQTELKKKLKIRQWKVDNTQSPQITAYRHAISKCNSKWILFVDADEFLILHQHQNISEFLAPFSQNKSIGAIGINWKLFGDSGLEKYDARPVIERFTKCADVNFPVNKHIKTIHRTKNINGDIHMHACQTEGRLCSPNGEDLLMSDIWGLSENIQTEVAQINHYYGKTIEEFAGKIARGQGGCSETHELKYYYNNQSFIAHNRNEIQDLSAQKHLKQLKFFIEKFGSLDAE